MNQRPTAADGSSTVEALITTGTQKLSIRRGLPSPNREARWLLAAVLNVRETWLQIHPESEVDDASASRFHRWVDRRRAGEPAEHLVGSCLFWNRSFRVTPDVLIPRPETELLVELALSVTLPEHSRVLDVGTGSGCLAVTLAAERPIWRVSAVDRSLAALRVARANGGVHSTDVSWNVSDLVDSVAGSFDLVVANLPYLPSAWLADLPREVRREPMLALDGGDDGLDLVRRLLADLDRILVPGGVCLLEIAEEQAQPVRLAARSHGLDPFVSRFDVGRCERIIGVRKDR